MSEENNTQAALDAGKALAEAKATVRRDLTKAERLNQQVGLYAPCVCGSGRKFKFCCKAKH